LAERIKTLREARGWTQEQLAERAAMQRSYLADRELGRRKSISSDAGEGGQRVWDFGTGVL
jgi:transcriptional regulator with XRE-family HTH domain